MRAASDSIGPGLPLSEDPDWEPLELVDDDPDDAVPVLGLPLKVGPSGGPLGGGDELFAVVGQKGHRENQLMVSFCTLCGGGGPASGPAPEPLPDRSVKRVESLATEEPGL